MKKSIMFLCAVALLCACTTPGKKTAIGAAAGTAIGAGAGALISKATGGSATEGAIYGGAAGLVTGGLIGNYYDKQAKELAKIAEVTKTENGIVVTLKNDILFDTGSAVLSEASQKTLIDLNRVLKKYPENIILVKGHTDSTGTAAYNQTLSEKRAKAVYDFILENGLKTSSLSYKGYAATQPVASNNTAEGRAKNRRVELSITANKKLVEQNRK